MKDRIKRVMASMGILILAGCAVAPTLAPPPDTEGKTWIAISAMGNQARFQHIGTTVFNNEITGIDTTSWALDNHIETNIEKLRPDLKWRHAEITPVLRVGLSTLGVDGLTKLIKADQRKKSIAELRTVCACDCAVIVSPAVRGDDLTQTNASLMGYGVHQRGTLFKEDFARSFISFQVTLMDLRRGDETGSVITNRFDRLPFTLDKEKKLIPNTDELKQVENSIKTLANAALEYSLITLPQH